jgi:hypothetical protein
MCIPPAEFLLFNSRMAAFEFVVMSARTWRNFIGCSTVWPPRGCDPQSVTSVEFLKDAL